MSHYDIHVGDVIKYPEMVMARTVLKSVNKIPPLSSKFRINASGHLIPLLSKKWRVELSSESVRNVQLLFL